MISLFKKPRGLIVLRMKQPAEWLPNGRTTLWFNPADGRLVEARDAFQLPAGSKLGGLPYKLPLTIVGARPVSTRFAGYGHALVRTAPGRPRFDRFPAAPREKAELALPTS
jgi:hypothetical protein